MQSIKTSHRNRGSFFCRQKRPLLSAAVEDGKERWTDFPQQKSACRAERDGQHVHAEIFGKAARGRGHREQFQPDGVKAAQQERFMHGEQPERHRRKIFCRRKRPFVSLDERGAFQQRSYPAFFRITFETHFYFILIEYTCQTFYTISASSFFSITNQQASMHSQGSLDFSAK